MKNKKYLEKEIYAERKASVHWYCNHKFRHWFYEKLAKYYQNKQQTMCYEGGFQNGLYNGTGKLINYKLKRYCF